MLHSVEYKQLAVKIEQMIPHRWFDLPPFCISIDDCLSDDQHTSINIQIKQVIVQNFERLSQRNHALNYLFDGETWGTKWVLLSCSVLK